MRPRKLAVLSLLLMATALLGFPARIARAVDPVTISGTVTDSGSNAIEGAIVEVCPLYGDCLVPVTTGPDGGYTFSDLPANWYQVDAVAKGYVRRYGDWYSLAAGDSLTEDFSLAPGGWISGHITDSEHHGIEGAHVWTALAWENGGTATSDSDGYYELLGLSAGPYEVCASASGYASRCYHETYDYPDDITVTNGAETSGIDITLEAEATISGTVRDASDNQGIANIGVYALGSGWGWWMWGAESGSDGTYTIHGLPPGSYTIVADGHGYVEEYYQDVRNPGDASEIDVSAGDNKTGIDFTLDVGGTISGTVTNEDDQGILNVQVEACLVAEYSYCRNTSTDTDGSYEIDGLGTGNYIVRASDNDYVEQWYKEEPSEDDAELVGVVEGSPHIGVDFVLSSGGSISGRVVDSSDTAIEGAEINACPEGEGDCHQADSQADGTYKINGLGSGDYYVYARLSGYAPEWYNGNLSGDNVDTVSVNEPDETQNIDFTLFQTGSIAGLVSTKAGYPVPDAWVEACMTPSGSCHGDWADANGLYEMDGLAPTDYLVYATRDEYLEQWYEGKATRDEADPVQVDEGKQTGPVDFVLGYLGTISGTVEDAGNSPIDGAWVSACPADDEVAEPCHYAQTNASGGYTVHGLHYLDYVVYVDAPGYIRQFWDDTRDAADATSLSISADDLDIADIDFTLDLGGTISGTVTAGGEPVVGAWVTAYDAVNSLGWYGGASTGTDGSFAISGVPTGSYFVFAQKPGFATEYYNGVRWEEDATPISVEEPGNVTAAGMEEGVESSSIDFSLEVGGDICGTVTDADGHPISNAQVYVDPEDHAKLGWWSADQQYFHWFMDKTAGDGTYDVPDLGDGAYIVRASVNGYDDQYYNGVSEQGDADSIQVTEGERTCSVNFVFGGQEPTPTPTPQPHHRRVPNRESTSTPSPTATATLMEPSSTPSPSPTAVSQAQPQVSPPNTGDGGSSRDIGGSVALGVVAGMVALAAAGALRSRLIRR